MALETLSSNEPLNYIMYDSNIPIITTPYSWKIESSDTTPQEIIGNFSYLPQRSNPPPETTNLTVAQGRKKRRRRQKSCKNEEEAENQRMMHIAVERNRRKQMNEHLAVLRSLMPESYVQRGDQASVVGGVIGFVKELEHILHSLEAKKLLLQAQTNAIINDQNHQDYTTLTTNDHQRPFAQFFSYPQFMISCISQNQLSNKSTMISQSKTAIADIEVSLIETHANIRILSCRGVRRLSKIVAAFQSVYLTILHLNVTTLDSLVLYSISAKVEENCQLKSADDITTVINHMLRIIIEEEESYAISSILAI